METPSRLISDLARQLVALEATGNGSLGKNSAGGVVAVCEKLGVAITKLTGVDGCAALMRRAIALARVRHPSLAGVVAQPDCSLDGLDGSTVPTDAKLAILVHLLALLSTFIGDHLTLQIVRDTWPQASLDARSYD